MKATAWLQAELEERIGFSTGDKMFSISAGKAEDNVELLPVIKEVSVERDWPNNVTVNVNRYKILITVLRFILSARKQQIQAKKVSVLPAIPRSFYFQR